MTFLFRIIDNIRKIVPQTFVVGVKLNSANFSTGGLTEDEAYEQICWIDEHDGVDFIEISCGTYEAPAMNGSEYAARSERTKRREAYFIEFAGTVRKATKILLIVTGRFRKREGMNNAIRSDACDFVGIARSVCVQFNLPQILLDQNIPDNVAKVLQYDIGGSQISDLLPIMDTRSSIGIIWNYWQMHRVAIENRELDPTLTVHGKMLSIFLTKLKKVVPLFFLLFIILNTSVLKQFFPKMVEKNSL